MHNRVYCSAAKTGYRSDVENLATIGFTTSSVLNHDLYLEGIVIDKAIRIEHIYYDFDKWCALIVTI